MIIVNLRKLYYSFSFTLYSGRKNIIKLFALISAAGYDPPSLLPLVFFISINRVIYYS